MRGGRVLKRIAAREPEVGAWAFLDEGCVLRQAEALDAGARRVVALGPLLALPVGLKDIIDTADMPTENGTPLDAGRQPTRDATVARACATPARSDHGQDGHDRARLDASARDTQPSRPARTPGGSSSGSAAAVAAGMVPLAVGTQTVGSVIRPASFCGVVGFKPTFGLIPRRGVLPQATPLDTVGVFARTVEDAALIADVLAGFNSDDPDSLQVPPPRLLDTALSEPPPAPALAFVKTPFWDAADTATHEGLGELVEALGKSCEEVTLPQLFAEATGAIHTLSRVGIARHYRGYLERGAEQLSDFMRGAIEEGLKISAVDYLAALDRQKSLAAELDALFDNCDAILTPAAPGEAPPIDTTGNPIFNGLWTLCGVPAVTLPLLKGPHGLPIGVQVVGRRGEDGRLMRTARWLQESLRRAGRDASLIGAA